MISELAKYFLFCWTLDPSRCKILVVNYLHLDLQFLKTFGPPQRKSFTCKTSPNSVQNVWRLLPSLWYGWLLSIYYSKMVEIQCQANQEDGHNKVGVYNCTQDEYRHHCRGYNSTGYYEQSRDVASMLKYHWQYQTIECLQRYTCIVYLNI